MVLVGQSVDHVIRPLAQYSGSESVPMQTAWNFAMVSLLEDCSSR